ncbi:DNA cytosine methyltransferase [Listeria aquatica]|uniref:DNA cytosine methyltransferase n=1 Tax=Listeria aquatica TaxID=1494960 RepID=UPI0019D39AC0|nr:DNA cytosine methyltransferase [Listeria aquatica]
MFQDICDEFEYVSGDSPSFHLASRDKETVLLKAHEYGVPQARERIFLVGINNKFAAKFSYPKRTHGSKEKI